MEYIYFIDYTNIIIITLEAMTKTAALLTAAVAVFTILQSFTG